MAVGFHRPVGSGHDAGTPGGRHSQGTEGNSSSAEHEPNYSSATQPAAVVAVECDSIALAAGVRWRVGTVV
jgi:hypothetical protein